MNYLKSRSTLLSLLTLVGTLIPLNSDATQQIATVKRIIDGDTLEVNLQGQAQKIQLVCIDAPDWQNGQPQTGAPAAKNRLSQILPTGTSVQIIPIKTIQTGSNSRLVSAVFLRQNNRNINVNLQLVAEGYASVDQRYLNDCPNMSNSLLTAQNNAQSRRLGIWR